MSKQEQTTNQEAARAGEAQAAVAQLSSPDEESSQTETTYLQEKASSPTENNLSQSNRGNYSASQTDAADNVLGTSRPRKIMANAMSTTEQVGSGFVSGVTHVATDMVHGVGDVGNEVVSVVRDTTNTAISGVGAVGEVAISTLTGLLVDLVSGVRQIGAAAAGRASIIGEQQRSKENAPRQVSRTTETQRRESNAEELYH